MPFAGAFPEKKAGQHGRNHHGKNQGAQQGKCHRPRHGFEEPSLDCLQGKDRQIGSDDNADGVEDGPLHFMSSLANLLTGAAAIGTAAAKMANNVLHHDHRTVHHHAEVKRAQR